MFNYFVYNYITLQVILVRLKADKLKCNEKIQKVWEPVTMNLPCLNSNFNEEVHFEITCQ